MNQETDRVVAAGKAVVSLVIKNGVMYLKDFITDDLIEFNDDIYLELKDNKLYVVLKKE